jgi:hypothetical protein
MEQLSVADSTIVTLYESDRIATAAGTISVVPAWRWALEAV